MFPPKQQPSVEKIAATYRSYVVAILLISSKFCLSRT